MTDPMSDRFLDRAPRRDDPSEPAPSRLRPGTEQTDPVFDFAPRRFPAPGAVVVYKRRKRVAGVPDGDDKLSAPTGDRQRGPRVFQLPGTADAVPLSHSFGNEAAVAPAGAPTGLPRRRRRNALHQPGQVHHVVYATAKAHAALAADRGTAGPGHRVGDDPGKPADSAHDRRYQTLRDALKTLDRTLEAVRRAQQFQAAIDRARQPR